MHIISHVLRTRYLSVCFEKNQVQLTHCKCVWYALLCGKLNRKNGFNILHIQNFVILFLFAFNQLKYYKCSILLCER